MYIKQVTIHGFKSYKDQVFVEPFSPHHNVVVGRNGSGKSNFFAAIRFCLNDLYGKITAEERQSLLHESTGVATLTAYVEIVFDNSDNRLPTGKPEVVLRRTIGLSKDEYSLDRKLITKTEVLNLLSSGGFSTANPYYIVPQGRVTWLTTAKDHERLDLLREVAGTALYEENRHSSLKLIGETDEKLAQIDEMLVEIDQRIQELSDEKKELTAFLKHDKEKRCCEYSLLQKELEKVSEEMNVLEEKFRNDLFAEEQTKNQLKSVSENFAKLQKMLADNKAQQDIQQKNLELLSADKEAILKENVRLEANTKTLGDCNAEKRRLQEQITQLKTKINDKKHCLQSQIQPAIAAKLEEEAAIREEMAILEAEKDLLNSLKAQTLHFNSEKERNTWIKKEIIELNAAIDDEMNTQKNALDQIQQLQNQQQLLGEKIKTLEAAFEAAEQAADSSAESQLKLLVQKRNDLHELRKDQWKVEATLSAENKAAEAEIQTLEKSLSSFNERNTLHALRNVSRIAERLGLQDHVFGPLYRLIDFDAVYANAVNTVAGNSLFHIVVDSDATAKLILKVLVDERLGRATFMPLNRLTPKPVVYPAELSKNDGVPLIAKLRFNPEYKAAIEQVFAKTMLCSSLEVASRVARSFSLNTITLDGDRADKRGVLSGGFNADRDFNGSSSDFAVKTDLIRSIDSLRALLDTNEGKIAEIKRKNALIDQQINATLSEIYTLENVHKTFAAKRDEARKTLDAQRKEFANIKQKISNTQEAEAHSKAQHFSLEKKIESLHAEAASPFLASSEMSALDVDRLQTVIKRIDQLKRAFDKMQREKSHFEGLRAAIHAEIDGNFAKRLLASEKALTELHDEESQQSKDEFFGDSTAQGRLANVSAQIDSTTQQLELIAAEIKRLGDECENSRSEISNLNASLSNYQRQSSSFSSFKALLSQRQSNCQKKLKEFGIVPEEAFNMYRTFDENTLIKTLSKANEKIKRLSHVNKKAAEQFDSFSREKQTLLQRKDELTRSASSIRSFIAALDQQKDETILHTFEQVAAFFAEIFQRLVPLGCGELILLRNEQPLKDAAAAGIALAGIQIKVSFNSKNDERLLMSQLSGGQKSLVALAFIFAIQKVDPAPFYLFDEIDANLDAAYRTAVAAMINDLSRTAQYITTTFRPELLQNADKFYGVHFTSRISSVRTISKDAAFEFIAKDESASQM